jgi:uncharacterized protein
MLARICKLPNKLDFFLFGPRATGKSSLLRSQYVGPHVHFFDLLDSAVFDSLSSRPDQLEQTLKSILQSHTAQTASERPIVVIDEIQKIPTLLDTVHRLMLQDGFQFVLTGSSARKLKRGSANLLGGRAVVRNLGPLTFLEIPNDDQAIYQRMVWGGLPKVFLGGDDADKIDLLVAYVKTYLSEEVIAEQLVRNLIPFRKFLPVAGQMNGKIINCRAIARDLGTTHTTVQSYFEILEDTLIGFSLPAWHSSLRRRIRNQPKFYIFDTGVARAMARTLDHTPQLGTSAFGDLFEHFIISEMRTLLAYEKPQWEMHYFQSAAGNEIDLVIDRGAGSLILIEIKSTNSLGKLELGSTLRLMQDFKSEHCFVFSQDPLPKKLSPYVQGLHWKDGIKAVLAL